MTKTFITTYTNKFTGETVEIKNRITDNMEERNNWKKAEAENRAEAKFKKMGYERYIGDKDGAHYIVWHRQTLEA